MSSLAIKKNIYISKPLKLVVFFILFLSSMRFILPNIYNLACAGFLLLYFHFFFSNRRLANTFGVMVIFTLVDNGGAAYGETPSLLRYLCYFSVLAPYFMCKLSYKRVVITLTIFSFYFFMTLLNLNSFDTGVFGRDLFIFFLFLVVFGTTFSKDFTIDVRVLAYLIFAFGLFEICNSFLYDPSSDYLSYDSTKALICFFSMYSIVQKKINIVQTTLLILLTVVILSLYVTRMIFVSYLFVVFLLLIRNRLNVYMLFSLVPLVFIFNYFLLGFDFEKIKLIYTLNRMLESGLEFNNFVYLDPVRFYELMAFLDSGIGILIGNGLGSGFYDSKGYFSFVGLYDTAFSQKELSTNIFTNFHDVWVDIGYRFGLVFLLLLYTPLFIGLRSDDVEVSSLASILIILVTCSFYSSAGLILTALLYSAFLHSKEQSRNYV